MFVLLMPALQEEVAQLRAALMSAAAEREEMERSVAEAASALGAVQHLYARQEQLAQREAELAAMQQESAQLKQQVGCVNFGKPVVGWFACGA